MDELTREFLIESQEGLDRMERCLTELEELPNDNALLADIFRSVHTIKGTTGFLGFKRLEKLAHAGENLLGLLRDGKLAASAPIITGLLQLLDGLRSILRTIEAEGGEGEGTDAQLVSRLEELQIPQPVVAGRRAPSRSLPAKAGASRKRVVRQSAAATRETSLVQSPVPTAQESAATSTEAPEHARSAAESTLRVDIALLNRMMNLVGELVLTRNQVLQATAADAKMTLLSRRLDMVTADLREAVMKARMQPVSNVFSKMPRIVRDLTLLLGRRVRLEMEGQETELDKSLLEAIKDPLTHAVRNALDHGIEPPDLRRAAGKDAEGTLKLRASQEGSHVLIEVVDDGAGISVERVRDKAVERGLISAERASQQSERELLQLIFLPGFSTASAITKVSGRGVGMDVVRTNVEKIGGKVEIDSRAGAGTTSRLRIPLTLAIIPAFIVRSINQSFALPQGALREFVRVSTSRASSMIEWIDDAPLFRLRGKLLPLVFLERLLNPERACEVASARDRYIAVLDVDGRRFGLVVDALADPEEIVVKPLSPVLKDIRLYTGATILGNGEVALILDPAAIALRSRIELGAEDKDVAVGASTEGGAQTGNEYLVIEAAGRKVAIRLQQVIRIEQISASRLEYTGARPVLHLEGQLLAVEDAAGVLNATRSPEAAITVVVCREGERHVGIAVSRVLDVAAGRELFEAGTGRCEPNLILLKDRITGIVDLSTAAVHTDVPARSGQFAEAVR